MPSFGIRTLRLLVSYSCLCSRSWFTLASRVQSQVALQMHQTHSTASNASSELDGLKAANVLSDLKCCRCRDNRGESHCTTEVKKVVRRWWGPTKEGTTCIVACLQNGRVSVAKDEGPCALPRTGENMPCEFLPPPQHNQKCCLCAAQDGFQAWDAQCSVQASHGKDGKRTSCKQECEDFGRVFVHKGTGLCSEKKYPNNRFEDYKRMSSKDLYELMSSRHLHIEKKMTKAQLLQVLAQEYMTYVSNSATFFAEAPMSVLRIQLSAYGISSEGLNKEELIARLQEAVPIEAPKGLPTAPPDYVKIRRRFAPVCAMAVPSKSDVFPMTVGITRDTFHVDRWIAAHALNVFQDPWVLHCAKYLDAPDVDDAGKVDPRSQAGKLKDMDWLHKTQMLLESGPSYSRKMLSLLSLVLDAAGSPGVGHILGSVASQIAIHSAVLNPLAIPLALMNYVVRPYFDDVQITNDALSFHTTMIRKLDCATSKLSSIANIGVRAINMKKEYAGKCSDAMLASISQILRGSARALSSTLSSFREFTQCLGIGHSNFSEHVLYAKKECLRIIRPSLFDVPSGLMLQFFYQARIWKATVSAMFEAKLEASSPWDGSKYTRDLLSELNWFNSIFDVVGPTVIDPDSQIQISSGRLFSECGHRGAESVPCDVACMSVAVSLKQITQLFQAFARTLKMWKSSIKEHQWRLPTANLLQKVSNTTMLYPCDKVFLSSSHNFCSDDVRSDLTVNSADMCNVVAM